MRKTLFFLVVAIALAIALWYSLRSDLPSLPEFERATEQTNAQARIKTQNPGQNPPTPAATLSRPTEPKRSSAPSTQPAPPTKAPTKPTSVVSFVVEDGYAVTHGDILLGTPDDTTLTRGTAKMEEPSYWDSPEIPFVIDPHLEEPQRVVQAILHIQDKTGIRFLTYTDQPDAIVFKRGEAHCASPLGRQGGLQPIRLHAKCTWKEIVHEILHSLGHIHEQSRSDRDGFIDILWDNIDEKYRAQFEALPQAFLGPAAHTPFDYKSIMLYDPHTFARDKSLFTMQSKTDTPVSPATEGLSDGDIQRIRTSFSLN